MLFLRILRLIDQFLLGVGGFALFVVRYAEELLYGFIGLCKGHTGVTAQRTDGCPFVGIEAHIFCVRALSGFGCMQTGRFCAAGSTEIACDGGSAMRTNQNCHILCQWFCFYYTCFAENAQA